MPFYILYPFPGYSLLFPTFLRNYCLHIFQVLVQYLVQNLPLWEAFPDFSDQTKSPFLISSFSQAYFFFISRIIVVIYTYYICLMCVSICLIIRLMYFPLPDQKLHERTKSDFCLLVNIVLVST